MNIKKAALSTIHLFTVFGLLLLLSFFVSIADAQNSSTSSIQWAELKGQWTGHLNYKDYGSGKDVQLPMQIDINLSSDQRLILTDIRYSDPGYTVHRYTVMSIDQVNNTVDEYNFSNDPMKHITYQLESITKEADLNVMTYSYQGEDNGKKAHIKAIKKFNKNRMMSETWVTYLEQDKKQQKAFMRNKTELSRP